MPQNGDYDIAVRGFGNLLLKRRMGFVELEFPADRLEPRDSSKLSIQTFHHTVDAHALEPCVAGRGDEQADALSHDGARPLRFDPLAR